VKAYGAGLLSSFGEMDNAYSGDAELRPFDAEEAATTEYSDQTYQPIYFVADSFEDMQLKVRYVSSRFIVSSRFLRLPRARETVRRLAMRLLRTERWLG